MIIYLQMLESEEEKSKFEQIYLLHKDLMTRTARKILNNKEDIEDAVHQGFLAVIENIHKVEKVDSPQTRSYLVVITERKAIDIIRKRSKFVDAFDENYFGIDIPLPGDCGLADAMAQLPARYREALLLRYDNGYSTRDIAKMFNIKQGSVQRLIHRAKKKLDKILEEEGI